ncbi:hypothetical protein Ancab_038083 [Ancistrocladus abbreviatus]
MAPLRPAPEHPPRSSDVRDYEIEKMKAKMIKIVKRFLRHLIPEEEREKIELASVHSISGRQALPPKALS